MDVDWEGFKVVWSVVVVVDQGGLGIEWERRCGGCSVGIGYGFVLGNDCVLGMGCKGFIICVVCLY